MIRSFRDRQTLRLWEGRADKAVPPHLREKALSKLTSIDIATEVSELRVPPSNRLHKLSGDRDGQWAISIDRQYRVCFYFDEDAHDVEVTDYHH